MKKDLIALVIIVALIAFVASGTKIQSVDDYYLTHIDDITEDSKTVVIGIRCDTVLNNWDKLDDSLKSEKYIPTDGVILPEFEVVLRKGDTVYDIFSRVTRYRKIVTDCVYTVNYSSVYVKGINHLYEFSCGELSGWMYKVNGVFPGYGCSKYILNDGDVIEWVYTCDLGRDIGGEFVKEGVKEFTEDNGGAYGSCLYGGFKYNYRRTGGLYER